jgi:hypothetical protein
MLREKGWIGLDRVFPNRLCAITDTFAKLIIR